MPAAQQHVAMVHDALHAKALQLPEHPGGLMQPVLGQRENKVLSRNGMMQATQCKNNMSLARSCSLSLLSMNRDTIVTWFKTLFNRICCWHH